MDQDMQTVLLQISAELSEKDLKAMIFLCGKNLKEVEKENITDGTMLFSILKKKGFLSKDNLLFLKELLIRIGRRDILSGELKTTRMEIEELGRSFQHISPYRSLLFDIYESLTCGETEKIMFLLEDEIKHIHKLNKTCMMLVLTEMEKQGQLSEDNLQTLNNYLLNVRRLDLSDRIKKFESEQNNRRLDVDTKLEKLAIQEESAGDVNGSSIQPDIQKDSSLQDNHLQKYKLDKLPHGWCLIVNNHNFNAARSKNLQLTDRDGTEKDAEAIKRVFNSRGYEVKQYDDLTGEEMQAILETYAKKDHAEKDSFVCFLLSHGDKGVVFGTNGKEVSVKQLTNLFNGRNCQSLVGKPKVFFIQACQGDKFDTGATYASDGNTPDYVIDGSGQKRPITADFLTAFASVEGFVSLRSADGSVYIQNLCTVLQDHRFYKTDLEKILTKVKEKVALEVYKTIQNDEKVEVMQMPTFHSELLETLILPPPPNEQQADCVPHV
ncbi:caspase-8-like [Eleutherodactylus coqui]|uniref:caspase-8-like n=1 Tax=Eleutherodactylus coqui TaxID=57060 RepID=UPI00346202D7